MNNQRLATLRAKKGYHILPVKTGQMLEVHEKVGQGSNERIWKFRGLVIKVKKPNHVDGTFVMRGKVAGQTIEKIYPLSFGKFEKVLLVDSYRTRRAKLYYIRDKVGKDARMKSVATAEEKGIDLFALAVAQANEMHASVEEVKTEEPAEEAKTEETSEEVKTEETSEEVKTEEPAEEAKTEETIEEVKTEETTEEVKTEETTEEEQAEETQE